MIKIVRQPGDSGLYYALADSLVNFASRAKRFSADTPDRLLPGGKIVPASVVEYPYGDPTIVLYAPTDPLWSIIDSTTDPETGDELSILAIMRIKTSIAGHWVLRNGKQTGERYPVIPSMVGSFEEACFVARSWQRSSPHNRQVVTW